MCNTTSKTSDRIPPTKNCQHTMSYTVCLSLDTTVGHIMLYSQKVAERSQQKSLTVLHRDLD